MSERKPDNELPFDLPLDIRKLLSHKLTGAGPRLSVTEFVKLQSVEQGLQHPRAHPRFHPLVRLRKGRPRPVASSVRSCSPAPRSLTKVATVAIVLVLIFSLLQIPIVARAFASVPVLGKPYKEFLERTGLDVAYQAGLINELNKTATDRGVTLRVLGAFSDVTQTVIYYTIDVSGVAGATGDVSSAGGIDGSMGGSIGGRINSCIGSSIDGGIGGGIGDNIGGRISGIGSGMGCSIDGSIDSGIGGDQSGANGPTWKDVLGGVEWTWRLDGPLGEVKTNYMASYDCGDTLFVMIKAPRITGIMRFLGSRLTLTVEAAKPTAVYRWKVTFPVQTIAGAAETVKIGKTFIHGDDKITLTELVFAPSETVLRFEVEEIHPTHLSLPTRFPTPTRPERWNWIGECFSLVSADRRPLGDLMYRIVDERYTENTKLMKGEARFWPTKSRDISILFRGPVCEPNVLEFSLKEGISVECTGGSINVAKIEERADGLGVTVEYTGKMTILSANAELVESSEDAPPAGKSPRPPKYSFTDIHAMGLYQRGPNLVQFTFPREKMTATEYRFRISSLVFLEEEAVKVLEMGQ